MSSVFSGESKRMHKNNMLNRLKMSTKSEAGHSREKGLLFSPSEVLTALYGGSQQQSSTINNALLSDTSTYLSETEGADLWCNGYRTASQSSCTRHAQGQSPGTESKRLTYAVKSIPPQCKRGISSTTGTDYGIYANQDIPLGTWIGPFEGRRISVSDVTPSMDTSFMWEIFEGNKLSHFIDASDENTSSWMRFICCARHKDEQNLFAFQYNGNIYYRAFKEIPAGTELLVWYDEKYPMYMGIPLGFEDSTSTLYHQSEADRKQDSTKKPRISQTLNTPVSSENWYPGNPRQTAAWPTGTVNRRSSVDSNKIPPLVSTQTLQPRRSSAETFPAEREQRLSPTADADSDNSSHGNNPVPSPTNPYTEFTTWQCQQCHKIFTQRVALQMHECPCQPEKPYQCGQCSQTFTNSSNLRAHVVSHSTERPFKCGYCSRTFVGATTLNNHIRTHMGHKPFHCKK